MKEEQGRPLDQREERHHMTCAGLLAPHLTEQLFSWAVKIRRAKLKNERR